MNASWASILEQCDRAEQAMRMCGLPVATARIQLFVKRSRPRNWDRVRVGHGVTGRCIGEIEKGLYHVDVFVKDVRKAAGRELGRKA